MGPGPAARGRARPLENLNTKKPKTNIAFIRPINPCYREGQAGVVGPGPGPWNTKAQETKQHIDTFIGNESDLPVNRLLGFLDVMVFQRISVELRMPKHCSPEQTTLYVFLNNVFSPETWQRTSKHVESLQIFIQWVEPLPHASSMQTQNCEHVANLV